MIDVRKIQASVLKLAETDPQDAAVDATVEQLKEEISLLQDSAKESESDRVKSVIQDDVDGLNAQIQQLHAAAATPARNFARIQSICAGLQRVAMISKRPQFAEMRPRVAELTKKVAGLFAQVDTVEDLDKPLEQIEKAVHSLYGDQSKNSTLYFERRNKGFHGKSE